MSLQHDELAEDLAQAVGMMPFLNVPLGSVFLSGPYYGKPNPQRADLIAVKPSYNRFCLSIYEVKVSRSDFLSDIRSDKWKGYLPHCHRFYFALPQGIAQKNEIPDPAGLYVKGSRGWSCVKAAKPLNTEIPVETLKAIIFSRTRVPARMSRQAEINQYVYTGRYRHSYRDIKTRRKLFGKQITDALNNYDEYYDAKDLYKLNSDDLRETMKEVEEVIKELGGLIGLDGRMVYLHQLQKRIEQLKLETDVHPKEFPNN